MPKLVTKNRPEDPVWNLDGMKKRVEIVFLKVQEAWMERDQSIAKDYMSEALFQKHKLQTDQMLKEHKKNMLDRINLLESHIVEIADYKDNSKDAMWVYIKGSMIDYMVDDRSENKLSGDSTTPEKFTELWRFIRKENGWVLDEIQQNVSIDDLNKAVSFIEEK